MKIKTHDITITAIFCAVICIMSIISIPIGTIPVSMANFAILLTALVLDAKKAFFASVVYILLGFCGLPVFAGFMGGIHTLIGPTGGYILSYPIICLFIGIFKKYTKKTTFFLCLAGLIICYIFGTTQFVLLTQTNFTDSLKICVFPFIIFDILKTILAIMISKKIKKYIK